MSRGKRKATPQEVAAGRANLAAFLEVNPRPAMTSGVFSTIASGELPKLPGSEEIERQVSEIIAGFVSDLGGEEAVTNAQRVILSGLRLSLLVQGLVEMNLRETGIVGRRGRPNSLLKTAATFINSARLGALALGLERKPRRIGPTTLDEYLNVREAEPTKYSSEQTVAEPDSRSEIPPEGAVE